MSFRIRHVNPDSYPNLNTMVSSASGDTIFVLKEGSYTWTTGSELGNAIGRIAVVGDSTNAKNQTSINFPDYNAYLSSGKGFLLENVSLNGWRTWIENRHTKVTYNRVWFSMTDNHYNYRFCFNDTGQFSVFSNCHLPMIGSAYVPHAMFYSNTSDTIDVMDMRRCTNEWIMPQSWSLGQDFSFQSVISAVRHVTPPSPTIPIGKDLRTDASVITNNQIHPNLCDNILNDEDTLYWESDVGSQIIMDLGSSLGVGEIDIKFVENQVVSYDIFTSSDLDKWHKVIGISPSSKQLNSHDLYGYSCRYLKFISRRVNGDRIKVIYIRPKAKPTKEEYTEYFPGFGPNAGYEFYSGPVTEPLVITGNIKNSGLPLGEHELTIISVNRMVTIATILSEADGTFSWVIPDELNGETVDIFGIHEDKKIHVSQLVLPTKDCSPTYPQLCSEPEDCAAAGGLWKNMFCWRNDETCIAPYYNCDDKASCENAGGLWWDQVRDCWGPDHRKIQNGKEKKINGSRIYEMGGYWENGPNGTLHHSNFAEFSETFSGPNGTYPDVDRWTPVKRYRGSDSVHTSTAVIDNNALKFTLVSPTAADFSTGISSEFSAYNHHFSFEFDYSTISIPNASTRFFIGLQSYTNYRGPISDNNLRGVFFNNTDIYLGYKFETNYYVVSNRAHGGSGRMRVSLSYQNITAWVKPNGSSNWIYVGTYNTSTSPVQFYNKIRMSWISLAAATSTISISNFEVKKGCMWPKNVVTPTYFNVVSELECTILKGMWDPETQSCCKAEPWIIDFAGMQNGTATGDKRLTLDKRGNTSIVNNQLQFKVYYDGINPGIDLRDGSMSIAKVNLPYDDSRLDFIVDIEEIKMPVMGASNTNGQYLVYMQILQPTPDNVSYEYVIRVKIEYRRGTNDYRYSTERRYGGGWATYSDLPFMPGFPTKAKIRMYRAYNGGPLYGYYWNYDTSAWVLISTRDIATELKVNNYPHEVSLFQVCNWVNNAPNIGASWARDMTVNIDSVTLDLDYAACGQCGSFPIETCVEENDCEDLGAYWQGTDAWVGTDRKFIKTCSFTPLPGCREVASLCSSELECVSNENYWYNNTCNENPPPTCKDDVTKCANEYECEKFGHYWYNNVCNVNPEPACDNNPLYCFNQIACEDSGYYWYNGACQAGNPCTAANPERCLSKDACYNVGKYWYNGVCNMKNSPTERTLQTLDLMPYFYLNFNLTETYREVTSTGRLFTQLGSPIRIYSLDSPGGTNFCLSFNKNTNTNLDSLQTAIPITINSDFTFEAVFNSESINEDPYSLSPFSLMGTNETGGDFISATVSQLLLRTSAGEFAIGFPFSRVANTWYHLVLIRKDGLAQVFLNGQPGQTLILDGSLNLKKIAGNSKGIFRGLIDEIAVYSHAFDITTILTRSSYVIPHT